MHQQPRGSAFLQPAAFEVARHLREAHQIVGDGFGHAGFGGDDAAFERGRRVVEFQCDEALAG